MNDFIKPKRALIFQQDGAPMHFSLRARAILDTKLHNRWIGLGSTFLEWPPSSPDLTPIMMAVGLSSKLCLYSAPRPTSLEELETIISDILNRLDKFMRCESVMKRCRLGYSNNDHCVDMIISMSPFHYCL